MSSPVLADDIVSAATKYLRAQGDVTAAVSTFVIDGAPTPGVFQYSLWDTLEGTGGTACVLSTEGGWAAPNTHNTLRFPRLTLTIWVDPIRDGGGNNHDPGEAYRRSNAVFAVIDRHLHRTAGREQMWGGLRVVSSTRLTEPVTSQATDGNGLLRTLTYYAITQG
jgi:hypothetical protein